MLKATNYAQNYAGIMYTSLRFKPGLLHVFSYPRISIFAAFNGSSLTSIGGRVQEI